MNGGLERVGRAVHGHLPLLHALQQRGLGLGRRPVDLVAEHDVGEDRPRLELELAELLVEGADPGDVAGQQVRGELDAPHRAVDGPGQRLGQHRLADPGHVLDEHVPLGEQHGQRQPDRVRLALDDGLDGLADAVGDPHQLVECGRRALSRCPRSLLGLPCPSHRTSAVQPSSAHGTSALDTNGAYRQYVLCGHCARSSRHSGSSRRPAVSPGAGLTCYPGCAIPARCSRWARLVRRACRSVDGGGMWGTVVRRGAQGCPGNGVRCGERR